ncbi:MULTISPECIES: universal stress protein [Streptomyces]|uniref:universal stress protein n=1 Tax=Streptomyces TaxID=1883 RepID=UPI000A397F58|nr:MULTISPECIES: universal stress protein [Streptomyces]MDX3633423.1 universal stress protein [Streptomyces europaeiscabiei]MDX3650671.1 universal stress protein [Streptomyces europaeiscabiei]WRZ54968.1 universal stress protein [Streptomyces sp. NBC_01314]
MELPLVVGVDGSDSSLQAVDWAADEAARHGLPLRLVYASLWERYEGGRPSFGTDRPAEQVMAEHIVASSAERAQRRRPEVKVSGEVLPDDAVSALLGAGHEARALVTGSRGRSELTGLLLGSVGLTVAARAVCPVVVVRGSEQGRRGTFGRVVVGVGDPTEGSGAVRFAFREAEARGCAVEAVRAWRRPAHEHPDHPLLTDGTHAYEERASAALTDALREAVRDHPGVDVDRRPVEGSAHKVLLAASARADLMVVGALRRQGHFGLQLGRVAHVLLHHSECPVAVVPQRA